MEAGNQQRPFKWGERKGILIGLEVGEFIEVPEGKRKALREGASLLKIQLRSVRIGNGRVAIWRVA